MEHSGKLLLELFLIFGGAKLLAEIFHRLHQPPVVGEVVAGILLGPSVLALIEPNDVTLALAEIGAIFILFTVGLETPPRDLLRVGKTAALVALLGVLVPFGLGFLFMRSVHRSLSESIFMGAVLVATSVGITARVLADAGVLQTVAARVILAAAVLDDILGMLVLAVVSSLSAGRVNYLSLAIVTAEGIAFIGFIILFGPRVVGRVQPTVERLRTRDPAFFLSILLCLGLSLASVYIGMAAIIGAFLAGLALAEQSAQWSLRQNARPIYEFLAPFFFVLLGARVSIKTILEPSMLSLVGVVCLLAIVSKVIGCGVGSLSLGLKDAIRVGIGMVPRGEFALIVAAVGLNLRVISESTYAVALLMAIVTTLFAPPVLRSLLPRPATAVE